MQRLVNQTWQGTTPPAIHAVHAARAQPWAMLASLGTKSKVKCVSTPPGEHIPDYPHAEALTTTPECFTVAHVSARSIPSDVEGLPWQSAVLKRCDRSVSSSSWVTCSGAAGFGATRDELEAALAQRYEATVEAFLHPERTPALEEDLLFRSFPDFHETRKVDVAQAAWV